MSEYQAALAADEIASPVQVVQSGPALDERARALAGGARQFFGDKVVPAINRTSDFIDERVVPSAKNAARSAQQSARSAKPAPTSESAQSPAQPQSQPQLQTPTDKAPLSAATPGWVPLVALALPVLAVLGMIAVFLPMASAMGISASLMSVAATEALLLMAGSLMVAALGVAALLVRQPTIDLLAGLVSGVFGLVVFVDGFANLRHFGKQVGVSVGFGTVLLVFVGLGLMTAAGLLLFSLRASILRSRGQGAATHSQSAPPSPSPGA